MEHIVQAVTIRWYNACAYYAVALCRGLKAGGHRVTLAGGEGTPALEEARRWGIDVLSAPSPASHNPLVLVRAVAAFRKFAREQGVSLVNVHNGCDHSAWTLALRGTGIPLIKSSGNQYPPKIHVGSRLLNGKTAGFIASCRTVADYYRNGFGLGADRVDIINGGIDSAFFTPDYPRGAARKTLGIDDKAFVFGIIGRFSPVKGHRHFFEAAGKCAKKHPHLRFFIAGWDARLREDNIREMARDAGIIGQCSFPGRSNDIRDLIGSIDAGIIASTGSEAICRIAMEYMAMAVPVVAADTNVIPELIPHGEAGFIVPAGDPEAMGNAMEKLVTSPDRGRSLGLRGREIVLSRNSLDAFARRTLEAYGRFTGHG